MKSSQNFTYPDSNASSKKNLKTIELHDSNLKKENESSRKNPQSIIKKNSIILDPIKKNKNKIYSNLDTFETESKFQGIENNSSPRGGIQLRTINEIICPDYKDKFEKCKTDYNNLESNFKESQFINEDLKKRIKHFKSQLHDLKYKYLAIEKEINELNDKNKILKKNEYKNTEEINKLNIYMKKLKEEEDSENKKLNELNNKMRIEHSEKIALLKNENDKLLENIIYFKKNNSNLALELSKNKSELEDIKDSYEKTIEKFKIKVSNREQEIKVLKQNTENTAIIKEIETLRIQSEKNQEEDKKNLALLVKENEDLISSQKNECNFEAFGKNLSEENKRLRHIITTSIIFK